MDNAESTENENSTPADLLQTKDRTGLPEPPPPSETADSVASGNSEPDCSYVLQAAATPSPSVHKGDDCGSYMNINGENVLGENPAERKDSSEEEHALVESSMVHGKECEGNGLMKKSMTREFPAGGGAVCVEEESDASEVRRFSEAPSEPRRLDLDVIESSDSFRCNQSATNGPHGGTSAIENGFSIPPLRRQQLHAVNDDDSAESTVDGYATGTMPRSHIPAPADSENLSSAVIPSGRRRELAVGEMVLQSDKVVRASSGTPEHVEASSLTEPNKTDDAKANLHTMCDEDTECDLGTLELRRQRDQARERAEQLEKQLGLLRDSYQKDHESLHEEVENLEEENRRLSAVSAERRRHMEEDLSRRNLSFLSDAVWFHLELQAEVEWLGTERRLKQEEVRSLEAEFHRFRNDSENQYLAALDRSIQMNKILQHSIRTLEAEVEVVSGCPALKQLLRSLRDGGDTEEGATSSD